MASVPLTAEFSRLVVQAEILLEEVQRDHDARKKVEERIATTRKAIAERDEATLRDCVERLIALRAFAVTR